MFNARSTFKGEQGPFPPRPVFTALRAPLDTTEAAFRIVTDEPVYKDRSRESVDLRA